MTAPRKIALFGGTFDPVHLGHIRIAQAARDALALDEVRFLPCRISPHKRDAPPTPAADRLAMLRLAISGLPWAVVDDFELRREGPSYSWQTAEAMAAAIPEARLFWIMGGDQWDELPHWAEPQRLAACVEFIVVTRGGHSAPRVGYRMHVVECAHPASATAIREALARGESGHPWLDPEVKRWILGHRIYRNAQ